MQTHIFGKTGSLYCTNWALKRSELDNTPEYSERVIEKQLDHLYMYNYLNSFPTLEQAITVIADVIQRLKSSGFNLTEFVSNNQETLKYTTQ